MRVQIEKCEQAFTPEGQPDGYGQGNQWTASYKFEGYVLDDVPAFKMRANSYEFFKGNFKKPPVAGTTENFDIKTKRDDPSKGISFPDGTLPDGQTLWRRLVARTRNDSQQGNPYNGGNQQNRPPSAPPPGYSTNAQPPAQRPAQPATARSGGIPAQQEIAERLELLKLIVVPMREALMGTGVAASADSILSTAAAWVTSIRIGQEQGRIEALAQPRLPLAPAGPGVGVGAGSAGYNESVGF